MPKNTTRIGKQEPRYRFFLNPYEDVRFTTCPKCNAKTRQRKLPLVIHVDPLNPIALNMTCRYCPDCDLLIAHKDRVESFLTQFFTQYKPEIVGNDYLVLGTFDRNVWREGLTHPKSIAEMKENLRDFVKVVNFEVRRGWFPAGS